MRETPSAGVQLQLATARAALFLADVHLTYLLADLGGESTAIDAYQISGYRSTVRLFSRVLTRRLIGSRSVPGAASLQHFVETTRSRPGNPPGLDQARAAIGYASESLAEVYWDLEREPGAVEDLEAVEAMADMLRIVEERLGRIGARGWQQQPSLN